MRKPRWLYLDNAYVWFRTDNDSFKKELGAYKRFLLDVNGYHQLSLGLFGRRSSLYRTCQNQVAACHLQARVVTELAHKVTPRFRTKALMAMFPKYYDVPSFWLKNLPFLLMPRPVFKVLRKFYQLFLKKK
jgi:hypothetical protein